ncbi:hypothetical protein [Nocardioides okcheonensis]|uniref:hypothetical protein n=1 Tax=Nocardioides okcheonensis TaxID=2894081 RepID=UPI001E2874BB|nr:hypothetical protein [Nocardioides okcheonensis]UFN43197.1 hypothetical protein LN652_14215 [Nocardioides okcheonensis]
MGGERIEDIGLAVEQYDDLNRQFFTGQHAPHVFLRHRLQGAMLVAHGGEHVQAALDAGLKVGELESRGNMGGDEVTDEDRTLFAALEAIVLFHHAAETMLRLLIALENDALCPWLEVARLKQAGAYPNRLRDLRKRLLEPGTQDNLAKVFYYRRDRNTPPPDTSDDAWASAMKGLTILIGECCDRHDREASLYNSAKHGLSAVPGNAAMQMQSQEDPGNPFLASNGPSITLLEAVANDKAGRKQWQQTTHWIPADRRLALTHLVIDQIENLWTVARMRYTEQTGKHRLKPLSRDTISTLLSPPPDEDGPGYAFSVLSMGMPLLYVEDTPDIKRRLEAAAHRAKRQRR